MVTSKKTIFITGAASGIGAATAHYFADQGWFVGLYDINETSVTALAKELGTDKAIAGMLDVTKPVQWKKSIEHFGRATDGKMHVLFNNAGIASSGWFENIPQKDSENMINVNINGVIYGCYAALSMLKKTDGARIINTASAAGLAATPRISVYCATKFAVRGFTEAIHAELAPLGIHVSSIMPWLIDTPILNSPNFDGSNADGLDSLAGEDATVYPVSMVAEKVWQAVHGKKVHYTVGAEARNVGLLARFMPNRLMRKIIKDVHTRRL